MLHFSRLLEIQTEIDDIDGDLHYYDPPEDGEQAIWMRARRDELTDEKERLEAEDEEYRQGYEAGRAFHDTGRINETNWGKGGPFGLGFNAAGQDS